MTNLDFLHFIFYRAVIARGSFRSSLRRTPARWAWPRASRWTLCSTAAATAAAAAGPRTARWPRCPRITRRRRRAAWSWCGCRTRTRPPPPPRARASYRCPASSCRPAGCSSSGRSGSCSSNNNSTTTVRKEGSFIVSHAKLMHLCVIGVSLLYIL